MILSTPNAPSNTMKHKTTQSFPEGSHPHGNSVHQEHSVQSSMTNQQVRNAHFTYVNHVRSSIRLLFSTLFCFKCIYLYGIIALSPRWI